MEMIKPIETVYNGYRFRSRLEARWAVFFDAFGTVYQYEPEGFDLGKAGYYLPDFWLPELKFWIEIKGRKPSKSEILKAASFAWNGDKNIAVVYGDCYVKDAESCANYRDQGANKFSDYDIFIFVGDFTTEALWGGLDYGLIANFERLVKMLRDRKSEGYQFSMDIPDWDCANETAKKLIKLDKEYWKQEYGGKHYKWVYGNSTTCHHPSRPRDDDEIINFVDVNGELKMAYVKCYYSWAQSPAILEAYCAARSARFEHGQNGAI